MSNFIPKALSKLTRFPIIALPYNRRSEAMPNEIMIDYDTGGIYAKDEFGNIINLSGSINASSVYVVKDNGDIISLQTLLNELMVRFLEVEEVSELAIFKIPREAQFDLKSVVLKNNLVQVYNFDQAPEHTIPIKQDDRIAWVDRDALLAEAGIAISAEGSFEILDTKVITNIDFLSVAISNVTDADNNPIANANGEYTSTASDYVWERVVSETEKYTATYNPDVEVSEAWKLVDINNKPLKGTVTPTSSITYDVSLIQNKKQRTNVLDELELGVYLPGDTGDLTYSKIIWKLLTGDKPPVLNFFTTKKGNNNQDNIVEALNIVWEYSEDYQPAPNVNNFYTFETWNNGEDWFGRVVRMGKTTHEVDEQFLMDNFYTKSEVDSISSWDIRL